MLKDLGPSTYSFAKTLLDEDSYIDASGLVVLRHAVREVTISLSLTFSGSSGGLNAGHILGHNVLCTKC